VVLSAARSEPPDGSVIAMAVISSPEQNRGRYFCRCSSVLSFTRYGATMSNWMENAEATAALERANSSLKIALKR
jgi:hypothetical protein